MALQPCTNEFRQIKRYFYRVTLQQVSEIIELHSLAHEEFSTTGVEFTVAQVPRDRGVSVFQNDTEIPWDVNLYEVTVKKRTTTRRNGYAV